MAQETCRFGPWALLVATDTGLDDSGRPDSRKLNHIAVNGETGEVVEIDFTPYSEISAATFIQLIDLEFPKRISAGPLTAEQVATLWAFKRQVEVAA